MAYMGCYLPTEAFKDADDFILECHTKGLRLQFMMAPKGFLIRLPEADARQLPQDKSGPFIGYGECAYALEDFHDDLVAKHQGDGVWIDANRPAGLARAIGVSVPEEHLKMTMSRDDYVRFWSRVRVEGPLQTEDFIRVMYEELLK